MKRAISLILCACMLLSLLPVAAFAETDSTGTEPTVLTYNILTSSYNIGNDSDGDGAVDDFGDSASSGGGLIPASMYNTWTDKTAEYFVPYYATSSSSDGTSSNANGSVNGYAWARGREGVWRFYPIYGSYANNKQYFTTYDYQNPAQTAPWQWTSFNAGIAAGQTYLTEDRTYINAGSAITDGSEPYVTLKVNVPAAGTYNVSVDSGVTSGNPNMHFYMLSAENTAPDRAALTAQENWLGSLNLRTAATATLENRFVAEEAGEYYFVVKLDNDNWTSEETLPTSWIGYLKSVTITPDVVEDITVSADASQVEVGKTANLTVTAKWSLSGEKAAEGVTFASSDTSIATVDENGVVTGVAAGEVTITATVGNISKQVKIEVLGDVKPTEQIYNITTKAFNIGNDTDGDGVVDDFGDAASSGGGLIPASMYNTWTDKTAEYFVPYYATSSSSDSTSSNANASVNGYAWARGREGVWRFYPIYANYADNKQYFTTYDYQNPAQTAPWQWTSFNAGITASQTYLIQSTAFINAGSAITDGSEPYVTLKLNVPAAGTYNVTVDSGVTSGNPNMHFYMLSAENTAPDRAALTAQENWLGSLNLRTAATATLENRFVAEEAGEYYFVVKLDNDNWTSEETLPTSWLGYLKSVTITPDVVEDITVSADASQVEVGKTANLTVTAKWSLSGEKAAEGVTFESSDETVATVDENGIVTGVAAGKATITATLDDISKQVEIEVLSAAVVVEPTEQIYNILTSSFNIGNDTDSDGVVDDFGDTAASGIPEAYFNTWTDKEAEYFIPYNTTGAVNGAVWFRSGENMWRMYPIYANYANNKQFFTTYDYQNPAQTAPWQWTSFNAGITASQVYVTQIRTFITAPSFADGSEPYVTLKLNVPAAGTYNVSVDSGVTSGNPNMQFYMLSAENTAPTRGDLTAEANYLGALNLRTSGAGTLANQFVAEEAGEYYLVIKLDDDNWADSETKPTTWYAYLKSVTLTPDEIENITVSADVSQIEIDGTANLTVSEIWAIAGEKAVEDVAGNVTFASSDTSIATVDENGVVTGVSAGKATITATLNGTELSTQVEIEVLAADVLEGISLSADADELDIGGKANLTVNEVWSVGGEKAVEDVADNVTFASSDTSVATVDENGVVTGVAPGTATITAALNGTELSGQIKIVVLNVTSGGEAKELTYSILASAYNMGNDTDGDGVVDDFGDSAASAGGMLAESMYITWTDKTAEYFVPYYVTSKTSDSTSSDPSASNNGYAWARQREGMWRFYPIYTGSIYPKNEEYFASYKYQNANNTAYWQWTPYNSGIESTQTYLTQTTTYIRTQGSAITEGSEPYATLKLKVPAAGTYSVTVNASTGNPNMYFYMLPATEGEPAKTDLINEENLLGSLDLRKATTTMLKEKFVAEEAGEYYLVIKIDDDNWEKDETKPTLWIAYLKSITLTPDEMEGVSVSADKTEIRVDGTATLKVNEVWAVGGESAVEDLANDVTFTSSDTSVATVDENGVVTGVGDGTATITAELNGTSFSDETEIAVFADAERTGISLVCGVSQIKIGGKANLAVNEIWSVGGAEAVEDLANKVTFTSSDEAVATVNENGVVTGVAAGKTTITATLNGTSLSAQIEIEVSAVLTFNILTSAYNVGNDTDGDGTADEFGDADTPAGVPASMYNTWTDKTAKDLVPFSTTGNVNGSVWARTTEGMWRFYPIYANYSSNEKYFNSYKYQNQENTASWQWTPYNDRLTYNQTYLTQIRTFIHGGGTITDGSEPYITLKFNIPAAGTYNVDIDTGATGNPNLYFYMLPVTDETPDRAALTAEENLLGSMDIRKATTATLKEKFVAKEAGEYYFVVKLDNDNWAEGETLPSAWIGYLKSVTLTPDVLQEISISYPIDQIEVGWNVTLGVNEVWEVGGERAVEDLPKKVTFTSSDESIATVDENGVVTGVGKGTAIITAALNGTEFTKDVAINVLGEGEGKQDVYIYFQKASADVPKDVELETDGWELNMEKSHASAANSIFRYGVYLTTRSLYNNAAIDVYVPHDGYYQIVMTGVHQQNNTGLADIYVDGTYVGNYVFNGLSDSMSVSKDLRTVYLTTGVHTFNFIPRLESGKTTYVGNYNYMTIKEMGLLSVDEMPELTETSANVMYMALGTAQKPLVTVTTADEFEYPSNAYAEYPLDYNKQTEAYQDKYVKIVYTVTAGADVISVDENGVVTANAVGEATLQAAVTYTDENGNVLGTGTELITVVVSESGEDPLAGVLTEVEIVGEWNELQGAYDAPSFVLSLDRSTKYLVKGINGLGEELDLTGATYQWTLDPASDDSKVGVETDYNVTMSGGDTKELTVTADSIGEDRLTVTVTLNGVTVSSPVTVVTARDGKTGRTLYTDEMIAAARENIEKYDWAAEIRDAAVEKADKYLAVGIDTLWDSVTSQDIPRAYRVGLDKDPEQYYCRYCKKDLSALGNYIFELDIFNGRWKITCPECEHTFPTNDFESFYELGRTVENNGKFERITALENHRQMLIEKGLLSEEAIALAGPGADGSEQWKKYYGYGVQGGYLYNETCPGVGSAADCNATLSSWETVEGWGVDDGLGYDTGRTYANGTKEVHTYIAYYNHFATWFGTSDILIVGAVDALADAYLYTGNEEYGRVGAILLDRIADIYPDLNLNVYSQYQNNDGGTNVGKAVGRIWECLSSEMIANAYDAFFPMYDDPQVVEYLNNKAQQWGMGNSKSTSDKIKQNIETGICREIFESCKTSQIQGNFGLHQASLATAAVVLDTYPDTQEMIDWLFRASQSDNRTYNTGGDINNRLVEVIYRDGQNYESPYYNEMGISNFGNAAVALERYEGYEGMSIYSHPKYLQMINSYQLMTLIRRGTKAIGDANYAVYYTEYPNTDAMKEAFYYIKDNEELKDEAVKIAQHLYFKEGDELENMHYDIFTRDPESLSADVLAIIEEYGEYDYDKSSILTGYGLAILRDGTLLDTPSASGLTDTTRDFTLNFSGHYGHNHHDLLDLGMEAFGLGMTTDLGYPETPVGGDPHSSQWSSATIGHNTVVVNEIDQNVSPYVGIPYHFDAKDTNVKVMDAAAPDAYPVCDEYRRTVVMIDYDDEVSYGIDFFRVVGGDDHLYTFQPNSEEQPEVSENLVGKFVTQEGGSYAGADVPHGNDPKTGSTTLEYPTGYTWMYDVDRADNPEESEFWLDYQIKDFRNQSRNANSDIRLRVTMLNDFEADEISLVSTTPQRIQANQCIDHLEKFLVRREGTDLDTLFTTVYEPYQSGQKYIDSIDSAIMQVTTASRASDASNVVKAVRVKIDDGSGYVRYDYVVYATNENVTYTITDTERNYSFSFRGFVGVWTVNESNENIYSYVNDGDFIGMLDTEENCSYAHAQITGTITDWQRDLSVDNWLTVTFDAPITEAEVLDLADRMINVARSEPGNSSFMIEGVEYETDSDGNVTSAKLDLGSITTISGYIDVMDMSQGYTYDVYENAAFVIPLSYEDQVAKADYSALDAELAQKDSLVQDDYTAESWAAYQALADEAEALSRRLTSLDQKVVDDLVNELKAAREALEKKPEDSGDGETAGADYSALDAELEQKASLKQEEYTAESWAVYQALADEAEALSKDLTSLEQKTIDDLVNELKAARGALQKKPADSGETGGENGAGADGETSGETSSGINTGIPNTGDQFNAFLWIGILLAAACGFLVVGMKMMKKQK